MSISGKDDRTFQNRLGDFEHEAHPGGPCQGWFRRVGRSCRNGDESMTIYECANCATETTGSPFRTTCPDCGGPLRSVDQASHAEDGL